MNERKSNDDLRIPDAIVKAKDVGALSDFAKETLGGSVDRRLSWDKALTKAQNLRRRVLRKRQKEGLVEVTIQKEIDMDKRTWPWIDTVKFYSDGAKPTKNNSCYLTNIASNLQFYVHEKDLAEYLEEGFEIPAAAEDKRNLEMQERDAIQKAALVKIKEAKDKRDADQVAKNEKARLASINAKAKVAAKEKPKAAPKPVKEKEEKKIPDSENPSAPGLTKLHVGGGTNKE
jgi:hypothetical protein